MKHELNRGDEDRVFTGFREVFVIFAVTAMAATPTDGTLDHSTPRQNLKLTRVAVPFHDFQQPATENSHPVQQLTHISWLITNVSSVGNRGRAFCHMGKNDIISGGVTDTVIYPDTLYLLQMTGWKPVL